MLLIDLYTSIENRLLLNDDFGHKKVYLKIGDTKLSVDTENPFLSFSANFYADRVILFHSTNEKTITVNDLYVKLERTKRHWRTKRKSDTFELFIHINDDLDNLKKLSSIDYKNKDEVVLNFVSDNIQSDNKKELELSL